MASLAGRKKISESEMSQEINLRRYLGRDATEDESTLFAELAVERINERTLDGKTIHGGNFKKYSAEYAAKKGVSRNNVDLFLEGDMLDNVVSSSSGNNVKIEIDDSLETKKGYNHMVGDTLPKRPWFGLTTGEAKDIAEAVKGEEIQSQQDESFTLSDLRNALNLLGIEQVE